VESFSVVGRFGPKMLDEKTVAVAKIAAKPKTKNIGIYSINIFSFNYFGFKFITNTLECQFSYEFPAVYFCEPRGKLLSQFKKKILF
jgi:hypothetical protein